MNYKDRKNKQDLIKYKDDTLKRLDALLSLGIESDDNSKYKRSALLAYWLNDFNNYLAWEEQFSPTKLKRYERGDVIKVNLGFNVGNEQGGMHYAVVLDNKNPLNSGTITIIPLSSKKKGKPTHHLDVDLGNDIYQKIKLKLDNTADNLDKRIKEINDLINILKTVNPTDSEERANFKNISDACKKRLAEAEKELQVVHKLEKEIDRMKVGSIGVVSQITTVSKMRIFDPRNEGGVLSGIKLSPTNLDLLNNKITELFLG